MSYTDQLLDKIDAIAATGKKAEKAAIIKGLNPGELRVLRYALDPFMTFGVGKKTKIPPGTGSDQWGAEEFELLDKLASRQLTGGAAVENIAFHMKELSPKSGELLKRVLLKDLRAGFTADTVNDALPLYKIPTFDVQLSHVYEPKRVKSWPVWVETKLDGMRAIAVCNLTARTVEFVSRNGKPINTVPHLAEAIAKALPKYTPTGGEAILMLDGEITSGTFNDTVSQVRRKSEAAEDAVFAVFDWFGTEGNRLSLSARQGLLGNMIQHVNHPNIVLHPGVECNSDAEVQEAVAKVWAEGGEGVIVKDLNAPYTLTRSYAWLKIKGYESSEFRVCGVFEGSGKYEGQVGGFIVRLENGGTCNVAGIDEALRAEITKNHDKVIGRLIEVGFHERTPDGSLRHPRFVKFRDSVTGEKE